MTANDSEKVELINKRGAEVWQIRANENKQVSLKDLMLQMAKKGLIAVIVEGGARVFTSFLKDKLADELSIFIAPKIIGQGIDAIGDLGILTMDQGIQLNNVKTTTISTDILIQSPIHYS